MLTARAARRGRRTGGGEGGGGEGGGGEGGGGEPVTTVTGPVWRDLRPLHLGGGGAVRGFSY